MNILINIGMFCVLSMWGGMVMMSPMAFAAENFGDDASSILAFAAILLMPIPFLLIMSYFNYTFLTMASTKVAIFVAVVAFLLLMVSGCFSKLINLYNGINNSGYTITETAIYHGGDIIRDADVASFSLLKAEDSNDEDYYLDRAGYATDKNSVYLQGEVIKDFSPKGAKILRMNHEVILMNESQVAIREHILMDAQPENFSFFEDSTNWAYSDNKDNFIVYFSTVKLPDVDKQSFTILSDFHAKDTQHIFSSERQILPQADPNTFEFHPKDERFAFDKDHVYFINTQNEHIIEGIDRETLEPLLVDSYIKDKNNIYHIEQYITAHKLDVDYDSFVTHRYDEATQSDAHDKDQYFYSGEVVVQK